MSAYRVQPGERLLIEAPGLHISILAGDEDYVTAVFVTPRNGCEMQHFDVRSGEGTESSKPCLRIDAGPSDRLFFGPHPPAEGGERR